MKKILAITLLTLSQATVADWTLNNEQSTLNFMSTKNAALTEVHRFQSLQGSLTDAGDASVSVNLGSAETNISIRNERLSEFLFNVAIFPTAKVTLRFNPAKVSALTAGDRITIPVGTTINLHGISQNIATTLNVVALKNGSLQVSPVQPIILNPAKFDLLAGIQKLQEMAKLDSITTAVPINFNFIFDKK